MLGQIALIEGMVIHLPDTESIMGFVARGLEDFPGVGSIRFQIADKEPPEDIAPDNEPVSYHHFPIKMNGALHGGFFLKILDPDSFAPYIPYLHNLMNMLAVILEERVQRILLDSNRDELEKRVDRRTKQLQKLLDELKITETRLRKSELNYRSIFENAVEGFFQSTPGGWFINVNPAFAKMLGYDSPEDTIAGITDLETQYYVHAQDRHHYKEVLQKMES